ncbi:CHAT domain-containing protein [Azospirillum sp. 412522]|nr:CHAT domain-containing protein [Azospirillum sp. 412522]MBY6262329.1 CHAT domain-containing protein [Azospirillum sp. 412522]
MFNPAPAEGPEFTPEAAFHTNPPVPRGGDIWCVGSGAWGRVGESSAFLLFASNGDTRVYRNLLVVTPPDGPTEEQVRAAVVTAICARTTVEDPDQVLKFVASRVQVRGARSLHIDDLVVCLPSAEAKQVAVIIPDAARYRGSARGEKPELTWCANLAHLAKLACDAARASDGYVLLDAGRLPPDEPESAALLTAADDDCGMISGRLANHDGAGLVNQAEHVDALVAEGRIGEALAIVESLPLGDEMRLAIKADVFLRAGIPAQAIELMQAVRTSRKHRSAATCLQFARIALAAPHFSLASEFLGEALQCASMVEELERILELTDEIDDEALVAAASGRLEALFPCSPVLLKHRGMAAWLKGDLRDAAVLLDYAQGRDAEAKLYIDLAGQLDVPHPDYKAVLAQTASSAPGFTHETQRLCVIDAQRRGRWLDSVELVLTNDGQPPSAADARLLVSAARTLLLNDRGLPPADVVHAFTRTTQCVVARLARAPSDKTTRAILGNLLSTEESGLLGRFALRRMLLGRVDQQPDLSEAEPVRRVPTEKELSSFGEAMEAWLAVAGMIVVGRSHCPAHLVPPDFHAGTLWKLISSIDELTGKIHEPDGEQNFLQFVGVIVGFAPHLDGPDRNLDIDGLKLAASCLARADRRQKARDVIEMVLEIAGDDPARRRAAWFAYAEVHRLTGDPQEAALAVAAALFCEAAITPTMAWYEALDVIRLLRDVGEYTAARRIIERASETLRRLGLQSVYGSRLETLKLQIDQRQFLQAMATDVGVLEAILANAVTTARSVLEAEDDAAPIAAVLIEALRLARARAADVPTDADTIAQALLKRLAPAAAQHLERFARVPTIDDLSAVATKIEGARYGHNLAKDIRELVILSRRYLAGEAIELAGATFAIELLADHGLLRRDEFGFETPAELPSPGQVLETAKAISLTGLNVALLGLNEGGGLVRVEVVGGEVLPPLREPLDIFSKERLVEWRREFPARYARLSERDVDGRLPDAFQLARAFDDSVRGLGVTALPPQRVVIIPDAALADFPVNLLPVDGVFAGEHRAMAAAPSLHWLSEAEARRARPRGPSHCWIPTANAPEGSLLPRVANDLAPILAAAEIALTEESSMPAALQGAELAIVAAHGGLATLEGRFFRSVADEADEVMASERLARGLAGAKVAILFVCNSTRLDMEPGAQANLGLARMLLDRGCSAVIGSPWPLRGDVPLHWLPSFLEAWNLDFPIIDANSYANEKVGGFADIRHALHVYGDPLVRRQVR